jgi:peptidoglycan/xylan/chitin deacetylase (PgdA/CDA1 family)
MIRKIVAVLGVLLAIVCGVFLWSYSQVVVTVPVDQKVVALTFDDGPNPPHTQALLDLLQQHDVKATFFVKGQNVEAFPESLRAIAQAGHEIGNHTYYHRPMLSPSKTAILSELQRTNSVIEEVLGFQPELFRPPYGLQGPGLKVAVDDLGMVSILMSTHGTDWEVTDPELIAGAVLKGVEPGGIILLHDGHGDVGDPEAQDSRAASVAATGIIIETLRAQGYSIVTVGALLAMTED